MLSLIGIEDPARLRIPLDGLLDVNEEVGFRAGGSNTKSHHLASGSIQIGDQTMACHAVHIQILLARRDQAAWARTSGDVGGPGYLIGAGHMRPRRGECRSGLIQLTYCADLRGQFGQGVE